MLLISLCKRINNLTIQSGESVAVAPKSAHKSSWLSLVQDWTSVQSLINCHAGRHISCYKEEDNWHIKGQDEVKRGKNKVPICATASFILYLFVCGSKYKREVKLD